MPKTSPYVSPEMKAESRELCLSPGSHTQFASVYPHLYERATREGFQAFSEIKLLLIFPDLCDHLDRC